MTERRRAGTRRSLADAAATKTARRRNDDTSGAEYPRHPDQISLVAETRPATESDPAPDPQPATPRPAPRPAPARRPGTKYTATLDDDTVDAFESLTRTARRRLGRHVDKVEVLRAVLLLAADDASLRDQLVSTLGERAT